MTTSAENYPDDMNVGINNVGAGWHQIIRDLEVELNTISPGYSIQQIKEKFGTLRYYASVAEGEINERVIAAFDGAIGRAERKSAKTCEQCGEPGRLRAPRGWYVTLCDEHLAERKARQDQEER